MMPSARNVHKYDLRGVLAGGHVDRTIVEHVTGHKMSQKILIKVEYIGS